MAILNLEYYTQKDLYSDGDIEEQMLKMAKEGVTKNRTVFWRSVRAVVQSQVRSVRKQVRLHLWNSRKEEHRSIITAMRKKII